MWRKPEKEQVTARLDRDETGHSKLEVSLGHLNRDTLLGIGHGCRDGRYTWAENRLFRDVSLWMIADSYLNVFLHSPSWPTPHHSLSWFYCSLCCKVFPASFRQAQVQMCTWCPRFVTCTISSSHDMNWNCLLICLRVQLFICLFPTVFKPSKVSGT